MNAGIEFLPPDSHAFSTSSADAFVDVGGGRPDEFDDDEGPRSRWVTLVTAVGVAGLFAAAVVGAQPWRAQEAGAPAPPQASATADDATATTNGVAATTNGGTGAPDTTPTTVLTLDDDASPPVSALQPEYVAGALPDGFQDAGPVTTSGDRDAGWLEVWATPRATRRNGSWFAVQINEDEITEPRSRAEKVLVGRNGAGLLSHTTDGVALLRFTLPSGAGVAITAGGWADADLVAMAGAMGHVGLRPVFASALTVEHEPLWAGPAVGTTVDEVFASGGAHGGVAYKRAEDGASIRISVTPVHPLDAILPRFVLAKDPEFPFSGPSARVAVNGRQLTAGLLLEPRGATRIVTWVEGDDRVSLTSELPLVELLEFVGSVRNASAEVVGADAQPVPGGYWRDAAIAAGASRSSPPRVDPGDGDLDSSAAMRARDLPD